MHSELRNKIYTFCAEPDPYSDIPCHRIAEPTAAARQFVSAYPFHFLALTHACKQLRLEFRPIWMRENKRAVNLERLPQYLHIFFPSPLDATMHGTFVIVVRDDMESSIDVTPLLALRSRAPKVEFTFRSAHVRPTSRQMQANQRLDIFNRVLFSLGHASLIGKMSRIDLRFQTYEVFHTSRPKGFLNIWYNKGVEELWMDMVIPRVEHLLNDNNGGGAGFSSSRIYEARDLFWTVRGCVET